MGYRYYLLFLFFIGISTTSFSQVDSLLVLKSTADELLDAKLLSTQATKISIASKSEELLEDAPSTITVFTAEQMDNLGFNNLYDLLNYVPGFQSFRSVFDYGDTPNTVIRGGQHPFNPAILILINGQRINDPWISSGSIFLRYMNLRVLKQVEIIRGPGSALYGSNAFLGVINLITHTDANDLFVDTRYPLGNAVSFNFNKSLGNDTKIALSGSAFETTGHEYDFDDFETKDPAISNQWAISFSHKKLKISTLYSSYTAHDFVNVGYVANDINRAYDQILHTDVSYDWIQGEKFQLSTSGFYSHFRKELVSLLEPDSLTDSGSPWFGGPLLRGANVGINVDGSYQVSEKHHFSFGTSFLSANMNNSGFYSNHVSTDGLDISPETGTLQPAINLYENNAEVQLAQDDQLLYSLYGQYRFLANTKLNAFVGARADFYQGIASAISPRIGLIYHTDFNSTFKLLAGSAFRAPSIAERFVQEFELNGNHDLQSESIQTYELVYLQKLKKWNIAATLFRNTTIDKIEFSDETESWSNEEENINTMGIELEAGGNITDRLSARFTYTYVVGDLSGDIYQHFGTGILNYSNKKWNVTVSTLFRGSVTEGEEEDDDDDDDEEIEVDMNYFLLNAKVRYFVHPRFALFAFAKNIGNKRFITFSEELAEKGGFPMISEGGEFRVGLEFRFGLNNKR